MAKRNPGDLVGRSLGRYKIRALIGVGGMGAVYVADHTVLGRQAAVKVLHPQFAVDDVLVKRFFHEARAAGTVKHPSIVDVYDFGEEPGVGAYIVMELLEGVTLSDILADVGRIDPKRTARIAARVASAVGAAHRADLIHRDLKPDNLVLLPDPDHPEEERVKVLDFGVAKLMDKPGNRGVVTGTGQVLGTPKYMSPEQCAGSKSVDARSDIYSLAVIAYEMLCGQAPFTDDGYGELMVSHITKMPRPPRTLVEDVPEALEQVILRALAKEPDERFESMQAFAAALRESVKDLPAPTGDPLVTAQRLAAATTPSTELAPTVDASDAGHDPVASEAATVSDHSLRPAPDGGSGTLAPATVASGSTMTAPPGRGALGVGIGVAGVALAVAVFALFGDGDNGDPMTTSAAVSSGTSAAATAEATAATLTPAPATEAPATPAPATAALIHHSVETTPPGATVIDAATRKKLGVTPWSEELEAGSGERVLLLRRRGMAPSKVTLSMERDDIASVRLRAPAAPLDLPE